MSAGDVTLTQAEWERIACCCETDVLCPIHDEDADSNIEFNTVDLYTRITEVLAARTPTATGESCPTCVRDGGPYRCCKCCPDDPGAHENGERDHHDLPCTSCLVLIPTATGDDLRDRLTELDVRSLAETVVKAALTLAEWNAGGWREQGRRIDSVERRLTDALAASSAPVVSRPEAVVKAEALQEAAQDYTSAADLNSHLTPESRRWLRERASVVARAASLDSDAP